MALEYRSLLRLPDDEHVRREALFAALVMASAQGAGWRGVTAAVAADPATGGLYIDTLTFHYSEVA